MSHAPLQEQLFADEITTYYGQWYAVATDTFLSMVATWALFSGWFTGVKTNLWNDHQTIYAADY